MPEVNMTKAEYEIREAEKERAGLSKFIEAQTDTIDRILARCKTAVSNIDGETVLGLVDGIFDVATEFVDGL